MKISIGHIISDLISSLNYNKVDYLVLRNYSDIPDYIGNDLDILINKDFLNTSIKIINKLSLRYNLKLKLISRYNYYGFYLRSKTSEQFSIQIDLYTQLCKGWVKYSDENIMLKNKITYKNFFVPNPSHELQSILFKEILTYGKVRFKYSDEILRLSKSYNFVDLKIVCKDLFTENSINKFKNIKVLNFHESKIIIYPKFKNIMNIFEFYKWIIKRF